MIVIHRKKTKGSEGRVPIHAERAVAPTAFGTYTVTTHGVTEHDALGWRLESAATEGQYVGHAFEVLMDPAEVDALLDALEKAKARFALPAAPAQAAEPQEVAE